MNGDDRGWRDLVLAVLASTAFRMGTMFGLRRFGPMTGSTAWGTSTRRPRSIAVPSPARERSTTERPTVDVADDRLPDRTPSTAGIDAWSPTPRSLTPTRL